MSRKTRILIARLGLDAHWRGSIVVARALRDAGMEVIYLGNQNPETIAKSALEEDVDVVGLSTLSGNHMILAPEVVRLLRKKGGGHDGGAGGDDPARRYPEIEGGRHRRNFRAGYRPGKNNPVHQCKGPVSSKRRSKIYGNVMKKQSLLVILVLSIVLFSGCSPELVFTRGHESALTPQIYRMKADGTQEINISQSVFRSAFPDVSPAGNPIVFVGHDCRRVCRQCLSHAVRRGRAIAVDDRRLPEGFLRDGVSRVRKQDRLLASGSGGNKKALCRRHERGVQLLTNPGPDYADTRPTSFTTRQTASTRSFSPGRTCRRSARGSHSSTPTGPGNARMITKDIHDDEEMPVVSHNGRFVAYRAYRFTADTYFEAVRVMTVNDWQPVSEIKLRVPDQVTRARDRLVTERQAAVRLDGDLRRHRRAVHGRTGGDILHDAPWRGPEATHKE